MDNEQRTKDNVKCKMDNEQGRQLNFEFLEQRVQSQTRLSFAES